MSTEDAGGSRWKQMKDLLLAAGWNEEEPGLLVSPVAGIAVERGRFDLKTRLDLMLSVERRIETMNYHRSLGQWQGDEAETLRDFEKLHAILEELDWWKSS